MIPGVTTRPWASITRAPAGTTTSAPIAAILPPLIRIEPLAISGLVGDRMWALTITVGTAASGR